MLLSSTHLLVLSGSCSFRAYKFNRNVMPSFQVLPILSSFSYLFNRTVVPSAQIPSSYQDLIQSLSFSIEVLPEVVLPCSSSLMERFQLHLSPL